MSREEEQAIGDEQAKITKRLLIRSLLERQERMFDILRAASKDANAATVPPVIDNRVSIVPEPDQLMKDAVLPDGSEHTEPQEEAVIKANAVPICDVSRPETQALRADLQAEQQRRLGLEQRLTSLEALWEKKDSEQQQKLLHLEAQHTQLQKQLEDVLAAFEVVQRTHRESLNDVVKKLEEDLGGCSSRMDSLEQKIPASMNARSGTLAASPKESTKNGLSEHTQAGEGADGFEGGDVPEVLLAVGSKAPTGVSSEGQVRGLAEVNRRDAVDSLGGPVTAGVVEKDMGTPALEAAEEVSVGIPVVGGLEGAVLAESISGKIHQGVVCTEQQKKEEENTGGRVGIGDGKVSENEVKESRPISLALARPVGLVNLGNEPDSSIPPLQICHSNALIQILAAVPKISRAFVDGSIIKQINPKTPNNSKGALTTALAELMQQLSLVPESPIRPTKFWEIIKDFSPFRTNIKYDAK
ncbi:hypothetical protein HK102_008462, partial [Quaeritorhiza haematococci]